MAYAELTDSRLYHEVRGSGESVLLIPGLGASCRSWDPIIDVLSQPFSTIAPDNRGTGRSQAKRPVNRLQDYVSDLVELLDHLQVDRAHVVGLSLGGMIAQRLAIDHPGRVNRLVLISTAHRFGMYLREMTMLIGQTMHRFPRELFEWTLQLLGTSPMYLDANPQHMERALAERRLEPVKRGTLRRQLMSLSVSEPTEREYRIESPTLVISGEYDRLIPYCYGRLMADAIPGSRFLLIRDAGHNPLVECPQVVGPAITAFLSGQEVGDGSARKAGVSQTEAA